MGKRGRPSAASLEIAAHQLEVLPRQTAPHDLTDEETEVWAAVVNSWPADWFSPGTVPILTQYCRHVVQARRVAELIEQATGDPKLSVKDYDRLLKIQDRESRAISALATKMRISQQSTRTTRGNGRSTSSRKPWEG
jgi:hypothetical protein